MYTVKHISQFIHAKPQAVYAFVSQISNLPKWASGLSEAALGSIEIAFAPQNEFGVLDHDVTLPTGERFHNPMRVIPNGDGSEITFTLLKLPGVTEEKFNEDISWIQKDLTRLKTLLEAK